MSAVLHMFIGALAVLLLTEVAIVIWVIASDVAGRRENDRRAAKSNLYMTSKRGVR